MRPPTTLEERLESAAVRSPAAWVRHRKGCAGVLPSGLVTVRTAATLSRVSQGMLRLWVETGAWPLPRAIRATTLYFARSDVEGWLRSGTWPDEARFQTRLPGGQVKEGQVHDERGRHEAQTPRSGLPRHTRPR